jgi:hypothetical protein
LNRAVRPRDKASPPFGAAQLAAHHHHCKGQFMASQIHRLARSAGAALIVAAASSAFAADKTATLFKIITVQDEIVIGLSADELQAFGGTDAGAVAKALTAKGTLTVWKYAVKKADNGDLQQAPAMQIGLLANTSLRVEPYSTPLAVLPHQ